MALLGAGFTQQDKEEQLWHRRNFSIGLRECQGTNAAQILPNPSALSLMKKKSKGPNGVRETKSETFCD